MSTLTETIEIIISDQLPRPASMFGHMAIAISNTVYSRAPSRYHADTLVSYIDNQRKIRDSVGYVLRVTLQEKRMIVNELDRRVKTNANYSVISNSCSSNIADVLNMIGVIGHDPRGLGFATPSPADFTVGLPRSKRFVTKNIYLKY